MTRRGFLGRMLVLAGAAPTVLAILRHTRAPSPPAEPSWRLPQHAYTINWDSVNEVVARRHAEGLKDSFFAQNALYHRWKRRAAS